MKFDDSNSKLANNSSWVIPHSTLTSTLQKTDGSSLLVFPPKGCIIINFRLVLSDWITFTFSKTTLICSKWWLPTVTNPIISNFRWQCKCATPVMAVLLESTGFVFRSFSRSPLLVADVKGSDWADVPKICPVLSHHFAPTGRWSRENARFCSQPHSLLICSESAGSSPSRWSNVKLDIFSHSVQLTWNYMLWFWFGFWGHRVNGLSSDDDRMMSMISSMHLQMVWVVFDCDDRLMSVVIKHCLSSACRSQFGSSYSRNV